MTPLSARKELPEDVHALMREMGARAKAAGLPTHDKKDSTGICFIGEQPFRAFLSQFLPAQQGEIRTLDEHVIGRHPGVIDHAATRSAENAARQWLIDALADPSAARYAPQVADALARRAEVIAVPLARDHGRINPAGCNVVVLARGDASRGTLRSDHDRRGTALPPLPHARRDAAVHGAWQP